MSDKEILNLSPESLKKVLKGLEDAKDGKVSKIDWRGMSKVKPPWIKVAESLIGTMEIPGPHNNNTIIEWARKIGGWIASFYTKDSIPWCGLFVAHCMSQCGLRPDGNALSARAWASWSKGILLKEPTFGCIVVFVRDGGGHVGFYVSEDSYTYHILGGNQADSVNITRIAKNRAIAYVWPSSPEFKEYRSTGRIFKQFDGAISVNEA